jgi:hypothetical protein
MSTYASLSDDHYVNLNLSTEMELPTSRETLLHFFEQLKKKFPEMRNFYSRDKGEYILEQDKDDGNYRWATIEPKRIGSGYVNPPSFDAVISQHLAVLEAVPYLLSVSPLDCESLSLTYGFDFNYRGNQHELLAETFGMAPALEKIRESSGGKLLGFEPSIQLALDEDCRTQCRLSIESRTSAYHVRSGEFPEEQVSVFLTLRRYGSLDSDEGYLATFEQLVEQGEYLMRSNVIENVLLPLRQAIALK